MKIDYFPPTGDDSLRKAVPLRLQKSNFLTKPRKRKNTNSFFGFVVFLTIYVARVPELENCHTHGTSPEEALGNAKEAIELWIETAEKRRKPIPEPTSRKRFSGKFVLRTSPELHASLAKQALQSGKSMNELAEEILDSGLKKIG